MNNIEEIKVPKKLFYKGPERHTKVFKDEFIRLFPQVIIDQLETANKKFEEKENKESILLTPHPIDYNDSVNFE